MSSSAVIGSRRATRASRIVLAAGLAALGLAWGSEAAVSETHVRGSTDAIRLEVKNASIDEILEALSQKFGLTYQAAGPLDRQMSGSYSGSLQRVLARVLDGENFVLRSDRGRIELAILTVGGKRPAAVAAADAARGKEAAAETKQAPPEQAAERQGKDSASTAPFPPVESSATIPVRVAEGTPPFPSPATGTGPLPSPLATATDVQGPTPTKTEASAVPQLSGSSTEMPTPAQKATTPDEPPAPKQ